MEKISITNFIVHTKTNNKTTNLGRHNNEKDFKANYGKELLYKENGFEVKNLMNRLFEKVQRNLFDTFQMSDK